MTWGAPHWLWLIPMAWLVACVAEVRRERRRNALLRALGAPLDTVARRVRLVLVLLALTMVGVALAEPARPAPPFLATGEAPSDVFLLMDVSRSMAARDVAPDRGSVGRMAALRVATAAGTARVGVAAFAAEAYVLVPPTGDRGLVTLYAESLDPAAVTGQGSDLARALEVAVSALEGRGTVVLISDGEGFQDEGALAAVLARARKQGVVVHAVQVGTEEGGPVPGILTGGHSSAQPQVLRRVAAATGGVSVDGADGAAVGRLVAGLAQGAAAPAPATGDPWSVSWLAAAALVLLLAESCVGALRRVEVT